MVTITHVFFILEFFSRNFFSRNIGENFKKRLTYWTMYKRGHSFGISIYLSPSDYTVQTQRFRAQVYEFEQCNRPTYIQTDIPTCIFIELRWS